MILTLIDQHQTLTTDQIAVVLFGSRASAHARLYRLRRPGWLQSFTPVRSSRSLGTHWVLGPFGARWAAHADDRRPPSLRELRDRNEALAASSHLSHTDGQNQVFIDLLAAARRQAALRAHAVVPTNGLANPLVNQSAGFGGSAGRLSLPRLTRWWSPARTANVFGQRIHPDGYGVWEDHVDDAGTDADLRGGPHPGIGHVRQVAFALEYDTGTETLDRLVQKVEPYRRLQHLGDIVLPLLFWLPSATREANLHLRLTRDSQHLGMVIATTYGDLAGSDPMGPAGPVWRIAGSDPRRHSLARLPASPLGPGGPVIPGRPTAAEDPLARLRN